MGIPQITAIMGMCVAGGAYLPVMCDHILMTEGSGLFLAGPALVQAAIGQKVSAEELGGAKMHAQISGTVDFREPDDDACLRADSRAGGQDGASARARRSTTKSPSPRRIRPRKSTAFFPPIPAKQYDMREIIARIVDGSRFEEYRAEYGQTLSVRLRAHRRLGRGHRGEPKEKRADHRLRPRARGAWSSAA